jgi:hypothetical protein
MAGATVMMGSSGRKKGMNPHVEANALAAAIREVYLKMHPDPITNEVTRDDISKGFLEVADHVLSTEEADGLMQEVDKDGSGRIEFDEFAAWMMTSSKLATELRHKVNTAAVGTLDNLINDADVAKGDREQGDKPVLIWQSEDSVAQTLWVLLEEPGTSSLAFWVNTYVQLLILIGSVIFIVETLESVKVNSEWLSFMGLVEWFCVAQFTIEYFTRVFCAPFRPGDCKPAAPKAMVDAAGDDDEAERIVAEWQAKPHILTYVLQGMNIVDFVAILPAYLELAMGDSSGGGLAVLRILRMARIFRMIKVGSYAENLAIVLEGLRRSRTGLLLMVYLVIIFMIVMASLLYMVEGDPDTADASSGVFVSIPHTFWCIIVTMSSVGYGDMFPTSDPGRAIGSFVMLTGILTLAVPITLIGNRFNDVWLESKQLKKKKEMVEKMKHGVDDRVKSAAGEATKNPLKDTAEEEAAAKKLALKKLKTSLYVAKVVLQDCLDLTQDDRFRLALDMVKPAEGEFLDDAEPVLD